MVPLPFLTAGCPPGLDAYRVSVEEIGRGGEIKSVGIAHGVLLDFTFCVAKRPWRMIDFTSKECSVFVRTVKTVSCRQPVFECFWLRVKLLSGWLVTAAEVGCWFVSVGSL